MRPVRKYSQLYQDRQCATITGIVDDKAFMFADLPKINEMVSDIVKQAAKLLRTNEKIPLIIHAFSNGGALVVHELERRLEEMNEGDNDSDIVIVKERLARGAQVFDSAPAFVDFETYSGAISAGIPNPILHTVLIGVVTLFFTLKAFMDKVQGKPDVFKEYWKHWGPSPMHAPVQAYVYSTMDKITKSEKLDELVQTRKEKGVNVLTRRFDDSDHVQHMLQHKDSYVSLMDEVLTLSSREM